MAFRAIDIHPRRRQDPVGTPVVFSSRGMTDHVHHWYPDGFVFLR